MTKPKELILIAKIKFPAKAALFKCLFVFFSFEISITDEDRWEMLSLDVQISLSRVDLQTFT